MYYLLSTYWGFRDFFFSPPSAKILVRGMRRSVRALRCPAVTSRWTVRAVRREKSGQPYSLRLLRSHRKYVWVYKAPLCQQSCHRRAITAALPPKGKYGVRDRVRWRGLRLAPFYPPNPQGRLSPGAVLRKTGSAGSAPP